MYLNFFRLQAKPFNPTPDPEFLYLSPGHKQALGSIIYGVKAKKGFIAITGQVGLGKTTILRSFLAQVDQTNLRTIYLLNPNLSFSRVLKTLLQELGQEPIQGDEAEIVEQLHMVLIEEYRKGKTVVLLIDEAQNMPVTTLEQLRMLSNLETPKDKLIQIVLLGQPELDALLDRHELRQVRQRIAVQAMIRPLSKEESLQYIQHRLDRAGGMGNKFFTNSALKLIVQEAKGIPRRLNILCDNALVTAFGYKKSSVTASIVKEVISDLTGRAYHTPLRWIPLAAGILALILALIWFMPLTDHVSPDTPLSSSVSQLINQDEKSDQDFLSEEHEADVSEQQDLTFIEQTRNLLVESVPKVLETLQEVAISDQNSNTIPTSIQPDDDPNNQEQAVDLEQSPPVVKPVARAALNKPSDVPVSDEAVASQTPQNQESHVSEQKEGKIENSEEHFLIENMELTQVESQSSPVLVMDTNAAERNTKKLSKPLDQASIDLVEGQEPHHNQESLPTKTVTKEQVPAQIPSRGKSKVGLSTPPITRTVKKGDTLAGLIEDVYGSVAPSTLRLVLDHNRHIVNVQQIYPGQEILFPSARLTNSPKGLIDSTRDLVQGKSKKLKVSKKIFSGSSVKIKPNQKKNKAKNLSPFAVAVVKKGDTLEKLTRVVYGSSDPTYIQRVLDYNPKILSPKKIFPGQDIAFPRIVEEVDTSSNQSSSARSPE